MASLNQKIGARLRCIREEAGFSITQVATLLGISTAHYRRIEKGVHILMPDKLVTLHAYMGVDPLFLLTGERRGEGNNGSGLPNPDSRQLQVMEDLIDYCRRHAEIPPAAGEITEEAEKPKDDLQKNEEEEKPKDDSRENEEE